MKTYIQIGSNIGEDDFQRIITGLTEHSRVFLIEPIPSLIDKLTQNYSELSKKHEIIIIPCAISSNSGSVEFYQYPIDQHSLLIKRKSCWPDGIVSGSVNSITFNELCKKYNIVDTECLFIDTEGMDYEILNSIDLSKVNIRTIYFEKWEYDNDDANGNYRSGPKFLEEAVKPKFSNYTWENLKGLDFKLTKLT
jgi:FkbM family methyltransferase